ncbi:hypothetical protein K474DRAFT_1714178 [Panus rudis PR-1116 ss-1]|nr:hypothetical protein K474DRAFT_1714178 [Panus rudis PR-1116 ss-1]
MFNTSSSLSAAASSSSSAVPALSSLSSAAAATSSSPSNALTATATAVTNTAPATPVTDTAAPPAAPLPTSPPSSITGVPALDIPIDPQLLAESSGSSPFMAQPPLPAFTSAPAANTFQQQFFTFNVENGQSAPQQGGRKGRKNGETQWVSYQGPGESSRPKRAKKSGGKQ